MKAYTVYLPNGQIDRTGTCAESDLQYNVHEGELFIEELANPQYQYVAEGNLVDMPPQPSMDHIFDYDTKAWVFDVAGATAKAYARRDQLLKDGPDRISPVWWNSMTPEQQQAWAQYRQDLLDIPQQPGFPADIIWPVAPGA